MCVLYAPETSDYGHLSYDVSVDTDVSAVHMASVFRIGGDVSTENLLGRCVLGNCQNKL